MKFAAGCLLYTTLLLQACAAPTLRAPTPAPPTFPPPTASPAAPAEPSPSPTNPPTAPPTAGADLCRYPPEDYTLVSVRSSVLNLRTITMLEYAQELYGGQHNFLLAVTQGSYSPGVGASFGTHDGGGAVDLSVRDLNNWHNILLDEFPAIIGALRQAGFAAWVREADELYDGSAIHIHAIAVGDRDLSPAAASQLVGPEGYFRGMNGLPDAPASDRYGGPILCDWMFALGYSDLRPAAP